MTRCLPVWLIAAVALGCQPTSVETDTSEYGRFEGAVVAAWDNDGRNMTLKEPFTYVDAQDRVWTAPAGTVVNGASIPSAFWTLIGGPFEGKYRNASVVHDVGCVEMSQSWEDVHRMFYEACRCGGVDEANAKVLYYAVYHFGPRWQPITDTVVEQRQTPDGQIIEQEVTVQRMARLDPPPPTEEELHQVEEYVVEENPKPEAIKSFSRASLHRRPRPSHRPSRLPNSGGNPGNRLPGGFSDKQRPTFNGPGGNRPFLKRPGFPQGHPMATQRIETNQPPISAEEQQWASELVGRYIEQQVGEARPAQYTVERARGSFVVLVQYLHPNEQGEFVPTDGSTSTVRLSRQGQIIEFISGS